jgi:hypothetical protein
MARTFNGSSDYIRQSIGGASAITHGTIALILRRTADGTTRGTVVCNDSSQAGVFGLEIRSTNAPRMATGAASAVASSMTVVSADGWVFLAAAKDTGNVKVRYAKYVYSTDTWTYDDSSANLANNATSAASGYIRLGSWDNTFTEYFTGEIAAAAVYANVKLTDTQMLGMPFDLAAWYNVAPTALWVLDQQDVGQTNNDLTGNGAGQSSISGTTVSTASVPVFNYGGEVMYAQRIFATAYPQTLSVDVASTLTLSRSVGKLVSLTPSSVSTMSRAIATTIPTVSVSATPTLTKQINKLIDTVSVSATLTLAAAATYLKALAVDVSNASTMLRQVGKTLALEVSQTPTMARVLAFLRTLSVDVTSTSTITRQVGKLVSTVEVASTSTLALARAYLRTLSVEVSATVTMTRLMAYVRTLSVDVSATPTMLRQVGKTLAVDVAATLTFTRQVGKTVAATVSAAISLATEFISGGGTTFPQDLTVNVAATVTMLRQTAKTVALEVTSTSTMARVASFLRTLTAEVSSTSTMVRQTAKSFAVNVASTPTIAQAITRAQSLAVNVAATASMARQAGKGLLVEVTSTATITRQIAKTIALSISATISLTASASVVLGRGILTLVNTAVGGLLSSITGRDGLTVTDASRGNAGVSNASRGGVALTDDSTGDLTVSDE